MLFWEASVLKLYQRVIKKGAGGLLVPYWLCENPHCFSILPIENKGKQQLFKNYYLLIFLLTKNNIYIN